MRQFLYGMGLLMAAALLVWIDQSPSDVANQVSLLMLLIGAGLLGIAAPRWAWLSALLLGACLAAAHAVYLMAGVALPYRDVAGRMGRSSYAVDLDHSCRLRRLPGCRRSRADPTAAATASSELGAVQHDRNTC